MIKLMHGDCLDIMRAIEPGSIDLIATDLPYGTTACKWDSIIPFELLWDNVKRVLKPRGVFTTTSSQPFTSALVMSNPKNYRVEWIWEKPQGTGHLNSKRRPLLNHESIIVFANTNYTYNPQFTEGKPYGGFHSKTSGVTDIYNKQDSFHSVNSGFRYPKTVLRFPQERRTGLHPSRKPVDLYEYIVNTYSNPGDIVLDPCMGSGTTGEACVNTGRSFIGIEKERKYYDIAEQRILGTAVPTTEDYSSDDYTMDCE
jgi:DNA modification methylase